MKSPTADPMLATYSANELARLLGLGRKTVYTHAAEIPGALRVGNRVVFSRHVIDEWLQRREPAPTRERTQTVPPVEP